MHCTDEKDSLLACRERREGKKKLRKAFCYAMKDSWFRLGCEEESLFASLSPSFPCFVLVLGARC